SYGLLIFILLVVSLWGVYHFARLGRAIDIILVNNYKSILAAENMKEALERQDSAVMFFVAGQQAKARQQFTANSEKFLSEFDIAAHNITEKGEAEIVNDIHTRYAAYRKQLDHILNSLDLSPPPDLSGYYFDQLEPAFLALKDRLDDLL